MVVGNTVSEEGYGFGNYSFGMIDMMNIQLTLASCLAQCLLFLALWTLARLS